MNLNTQLLANRIFRRLENDLRSRKGLRDAWDSVDPETMAYEIRPEWLSIIREESERVSE